MAVEEDLTQIMKGMLPGKEVGSIHFYGNRGVNIYKDYDAIICFGAPGTNQTERLDEAMALYDDPKEHKPWFQHKADAELLQTIHRIRPVNGNKNIIFLNSRWVPELGRINCEIDTRSGNTKTYHSTEKAYQSLAIFYKVHGFVSVEIGYALEIGHVSKKKLIQQVTSARSICLINNYIGKRTLKTRFQNDGLILFKNKNSWSMLINKLQTDYIGQLYENKVHSQWTKAYGDINAVREFFRAVGVKFNKKNWKKKCKL